MYRLTVTYDHPDHPEKFLRHYREVHAVLAGKLPNLLSYEWGLCETPDGSKPCYFLVAVLDWASKEDAMLALQSAAGEEASADIANFTTPDRFHLSFSEVTKNV